MTILIACAHPDDEILGCGGTIAKAAQQGEKVIVVIFTQGEASHPWLDPETIHAQRKSEIEQAGEIVGIHKVHFLDCRDGHLKKDAKRTKTRNAFKRLVVKYQPEKIFTHSLDDMPFGHSAVHKAVMAVTRELIVSGQLDTELWGFNIWTMNIRQRKKPALLVDVSDVHHKKRKALQCFKSQKVALYQLVPFVMATDFFNGLDHNSLFAERFVQLL